MKYFLLQKKIWVNYFSWFFMIFHDFSWFFMIFNNLIYFFFIFNLFINRNHNFYFLFSLFEYLHTNNLDYLVIFWIKIIYTRNIFCYKRKSELIIIFMIFHNFSWFLIIWYTSFSNLIYLSIEIIIFIFYFRYSNIYIPIICII